MMDEYWLKYGFKENGELACVRVLSKNKPNEGFYYEDADSCKQVRNPRVVKLTKEILENMEGGKNEDCSKLG